MKALLVMSLAAAAAVGLVLVVAGVSNSIKTTTKAVRISVSTLDDIPNSTWSRLRGKRFYFGHQSVGQDIVSGISEIFSKSETIQLTLSEGTQFSGGDRGLIFHSKIGRNTRASSKIRAFRKILEDNAGSPVDVALMKFCYVDIGHGTDVASLFEEYSRTLAELEEEFPRTVFVHVTVPIESMPKDAKGVLKHWLKSLIGRPGVVENNRSRQKYNELLRDRYADREPIFDLAAYESVARGGRRTVRRSGSTDVEFMATEQTYDGGHLNSEGRNFVAVQLLVVLAESLGTQDRQ